MSEPESKKLEERLEAILAERGPLDPYLSPTVWEVARDALAALREKDAMIEFLNDAIGGWKAGARKKDEEIAGLRADMSAMRSDMNCVLLAGTTHNNADILRWARQLGSEL